MKMNRTNLKKKKKESRSLVIQAYEGCSSLQTNPSMNPLQFVTENLKLGNPLSTKRILPQNFSFETYITV